MAWVTPKMNWSANDYYNLEDANRIVGNIIYLKDLLTNFGLFHNPFTLLLYRGRSNSGYYMYSQLSITTSTFPSIALLTKGYTAFASREQANWYTVMLLSIVWKTFVDNDYMIPYLSEYQHFGIDSSIGTGSSWTPSYFYEGYGATLTISGASTAANYLQGLFNTYWGVFPPSNYPFELEIFGASGKSWTRMLSNEPLQNKKFWNYTDLNLIEGRLKTIHDQYVAKYGE